MNSDFHDVKIHQNLKDHVNLEDHVSLYYLHNINILITMLTYVSLY